MERGSSAHPGDTLGLHVTCMLGVRESTRGLLWEGEMAVQQRLGRARDGRAGGADGGWGRNSEGSITNESQGEDKSAGRGPMPWMGWSRIDCEFISCRMLATDTSWMLRDHSSQRFPSGVQKSQSAAGPENSRPVLRPRPRPPWGHWAARNT